MSAPSKPTVTAGDLFHTLAAWLHENYPGQIPDRLRIYLVSGRKIDLPVIAAPIPAVVAAAAAEPFIPTPFQEAILEALDGKALRTDALGAKVGDRSRLFRHPGGLKELQEQELVAHHKRLGFYRPDAPPEELSDNDAD
jgi:hypothetical protein